MIESLQQTIERLETLMQRVVNTATSLDWEDIPDILDVIRELKARLEVAREALLVNAKPRNSTNACIATAQEALAATDLSKPFPRPAASL